MKLAPFEGIITIRQLIVDIARHLDAEEDRLGRVGRRGCLSGTARRHEPDLEHPWIAQLPFSEVPEHAVPGGQGEEVIPQAYGAVLLEVFSQSLVLVLPVAQLALHVGQHSAGYGLVFVTERVALALVAIDRS